MKRLFIAILALSLVLPVSAQRVGNAGMPSSLRPTPDKWSDPTGHYAVTMEVYADFPDYTIYRPANLGAFRKEKSLPVVIMMGPGCNQDGDSFRPFWTEVASHGYLVIAVGAPLPGGYMPPIFYLGTEDIRTAMDWISDRAKDPESPFYKIADADRLSLWGQSCGGIQCLRQAEDPRVDNLIFWNSASILMGNIDRDAPHVFGEGRDIYGKRDLKQLVLSLDIPIAYFAGDTGMERQAALGDFNDLTSVPVVYAVRAIPGDAHAGTFREKNGGAFAKAAVAWLEWRFGDAKKGKSAFVGKNTLALDPDWVELKTKNIK